MNIREVNTQIRDFVNDSTIKRTNLFTRKEYGDWNQFCSALDTIDDTCIATVDFSKSPQLFLENPYLLTYGLLQALYVQQDAVDFLKQALFGRDKRILWWKDKKYTELNKVRELRNETVGHPVNNKNLVSCHIDRSTLSPEGFEYALWDNASYKRKKVIFADILNLQNEYLSIELQSILKELIKEEKSHKSKFKGEKLLSIASQKSLYELRLIYGLQWNDHLAWPSFNHYHDRYRKIRNGLEARYGKFGDMMRVPGTEILVKKLDHIFSKIESFKGNKLNNDEVDVYVEALEQGWEELEDHLKHVDDDFRV